MCNSVRGREKMGELVSSGLKKAALPENSMIAVSGGLIRILPYWQSEFENTIEKETGVTRFIYAPDGLLRGIMALAKENEKC